MFDRASTTAQIMKEIIKEGGSKAISMVTGPVITALPAIGTTLAHRYIQVARELDASDTKDDIKEGYAALSSLINIGSLTLAQLLLLSKLLNSEGLSNLSTKQHFLITAGYLMGTGALLYTTVVAGQEKQVVAAGIVAAVGTFSLTVAKELWKQRGEGEVQEERQVLLP